MKNRKLILLALVVAVMMMAAPAYARQAVSTSMVMRVSHMTQNAVVDAGEDLSLEVNVNGVTPAAYQWFFEGNQIQGADQKVYNITNAQTDDTGVYRMEAYDADGNLLVSMENSVRVVDNTVPKSGDGRIAPQVVIAMMLAAAGVMVMTLRKRTAC